MFAEGLGLKGTRPIGRELSGFGERLGLNASPMSAMYGDVFGGFCFRFNSTLNWLGHFSDKAHR